MFTFSFQRGDLHVARRHKDPRFKSKTLPDSVSRSLCFVYFVNFSCVIIPKAYAYFERFVSPLSEARHFPLVRGDIRAINDLLITLDHLIQSKNDLIYVLSSSYTLNEDILIMASRMNHMTVHNHFLPVYHVDKRDGFPHQFFDAKYVVLGEPIQYHLRPSDQTGDWYSGRSDSSAKGDRVVL